MIPAPPLALKFGEIEAKHSLKVGFPAHGRPNSPRSSACQAWRLHHM